MPWVEPIARRAAWATIAAIVVAFLALASKVVIPLALGALLSFLLTPIVAFLTRWIHSRVAAVIITCTLTFAVLCGAGFVLGQQMYDFASQLPSYQQTITQKIRSLRSGSNGVLGRFVHSVGQIQHDVAATTEPTPDVQKVQVVGNAETDATLSSTADYIGPVFEPAALGGFVLLLAVMLLLHGPDLRDRILVLAGTQQISMTTQALEEAGERIGRYLLFQAMVNTLFGASIAIGLLFIGVPNALLFGCLAGVLRFIPVIGPWLGAVLPLLLAMAVFDGWHQMFYVLALFGGVELTINTAVEPWLYGASTGISGVAIVVAILFWTWVWGSVGLLLAVPMTVCLVVIGKYVEPLRVFYILFSDEEVLAGDRRLYHRLVGGDLVSAEEIVADSITAVGEAKTCDQLIVPVILNARADFERGTLSDTRYRLVCDSVESLAPPPPAPEIAPKPVIGCVAVETEDRLTNRVVATAITSKTTEPLQVMDNLMRSELSQHIRDDGLSALILVSSSADSFARSRLLVKGLAAGHPGLRLIVVDVANVAKTYPWDKSLNVTFCESTEEVVNRVEQIRRERISLDKRADSADEDPAEAPVGVVAPA